MLPSVLIIWYSIFSYNNFFLVCILTAFAIPADHMLFINSIDRKKCFNLHKTGKDAKVRGLAAPSNLSMNQTLEGHTGKF